MEIFDANQQALIKQKTMENGYGKDWWIGLDDLQEEGAYRWTYSNLDSAFFAWGPWEPDNPASQDVMALWSSQDYYWADLPVGYTTNMYALCQYHPGIITTYSPCKIISIHRVI